MHYVCIGLWAEPTLVLLTMFIDGGNNMVNLCKQNSLDRKSKVSEKSQLLLHKFMQQLEKIFKKLPNCLEWKSFYVNCFPLVRGICKDIRKISFENQLNKSQIKAISEVKKTSNEAYQHIVNNTQSSDTKKNENKNQGENWQALFP